VVCDLLLKADLEGPYPHRLHSSFTNYLGHMTSISVHFCSTQKPRNFGFLQSGHTEQVL